MSVSLHSFPRGVEELRWSAALKIGKRLTRNARVCSEHFTLDMTSSVNLNIITSQMEFLSWNFKSQIFSSLTCCIDPNAAQKRLKENAFPSKKKNHSSFRSDIKLTNQESNEREEWKSRKTILCQWKVSWFLMARISAFLLFLYPLNNYFYNERAH